MDYKLLLQKYINHVRQSEGIDFIDRLNNRMDSDVEFISEEVVELQNLSKQSDQPQQ